MSIDVNSQEFKDALAAAIEAEVAGLKEKNRELTAKLKKVREVNPEDFAKLEENYEKAMEQLDAANKQVKELTKTQTTLQKQLESESGFTQKLLVENGLTEALTAAGVAAPFLPFVKAKFASEVTIKQDGTERKAIVGDKALGDYISEWAKSKDAEHFISAKPNAGGGASGGNNQSAVKNPFAKDTFNLTEQGRLIKENPQLAEQLQAAAGA